MSYLDLYPPKGTIQWYQNRSDNTPSGVCVLNTLEPIDEFLTEGYDTLSVGRYVRKRTTPGSYHWVADNNSGMILVDWHHGAFSEQPMDTVFDTHTPMDLADLHTCSLLACATGLELELMSEEWTAPIIHYLAAGAVQYSRWLHENHGVIIPARRIRPDEAFAGTPGFVNYQTLNPSVVSGLPTLGLYNDFLIEYARHYGRNQDMILLVRVGAEWYVTDLVHYRKLPGGEALSGASAILEKAGDEAGRPLHVVLEFEDERDLPGGLSSLGVRLDREVTTVRHDVFALERVLREMDAKLDDLSAEILGTDEPFGEGA